MSNLSPDSSEKTIRVFDARRRLLVQALDLAGLEVGPEDETVSSTYDASVEMAEEFLEKAAREFIQALDEERA